MPWFCSKALVIAPKSDNAEVDDAEIAVPSEADQQLVPLAPCCCKNAL